MLWDKDYWESLEPGFVLFCTPHESDDDVQAAKDFCQMNQFTYENVKIKITKNENGKAVIVVKR